MYVAVFLVARGRNGPEEVLKLVKVALLEANEHLDRVGSIGARLSTMNNVRFNHGHRTGP